eukprot:5948446-Amphidinium_carterae.3
MACQAGVAQGDGHEQDGDVISGYPSSETADAELATRTHATADDPSSCLNLMKLENIWLRVH